MELRQQALQLLMERDPCRKAAQAAALGEVAARWPLADAAAEPLPEPAGLPGRPERPALVAPSALKQRSVATREPAPRNARA
jgi:uncharacterized ferritin-like protein (DUF455 family)